MVLAGDRAGSHPPQGRPVGTRSVVTAARPISVRGRAGIGRVAADRERVRHPLQRLAGILSRPGDRRRAAAFEPRRTDAVPAAGGVDAALPAARLSAETGSGRNRRRAAIAVAAEYYRAALVRRVAASRAGFESAGVAGVEIG